MNRIQMVVFDWAGTTVDYGTAGVVILLVFLVAYMIERVFVRIKRKFN